MAKTERRDVEINLKGKDSTGPAAASAERNIDRVIRKQREVETRRGRSLLNDAGGVGGDVYGPGAMRGRFANRSVIEQEARDLRAGHIRAMRAAQRRAEVERLAGIPQAAGPEAPGMFAANGALAQNMQMLRGAGGAAVLGIAGTMLARTAATAERMATAYRQGRVSAGEMTDEILRGLPLIGNFYAATADIVEAVTGEKAERQRINAIIRDSSQQLDRATRREVEAIKEIRKQRAEMARETAGVRGRAALINLSPGARSDAEAGINFREQQEAQQRAIEEQEGKVARQRALINETIPRAISDVERAVRAARSEEERQALLLKRSQILGQNQLARDRLAEEEALLNSMRDARAAGSEAFEAEDRARRQRAARERQGAIERAADNERSVREDHLAEMRRSAVEEHAEQLAFLGRRLDAERVLREQAHRDAVIDIRRRAQEQFRAAMLEQGVNGPAAMIRAGLGIGARANEAEGAANARLSGRNQRATAESIVGPVVQALMERARRAGGGFLDRETASESRLLTGVRGAGGPMDRANRVLEQIEKHEQNIRRLLELMNTAIGLLPTRIATSVTPPVINAPLS